MMKNKFIYKKHLKDGLILTNSGSENVKGLSQLQKIVFPKLSEEEWFSESHYLKHIETFPEGQFVILDGDKVIGMSTTMRSHLVLESHTFLEISGNNYLTTHDPDGEWLYGLDVGVDHDYRGKGLGREIYRARQRLVKHFGLKGQITVGMINGYHKVKNDMTQREYYNKLINREITDPTITVQEKFGFKMHHLIKDYCDDPTCGNCGVLLTMDASQVI